MIHSHMLIMVIMALAFNSCGADTATKGFFTDANICRPLPLSEENPLDVLAGKFAIPIPSLGETRTAQLTGAETTKSNVWGAELFLSGTSVESGKLNVSVQTKRVETNVSEIQTLGPDGSTAGQLFTGRFQTLNAGLEPAWVKVQFPGIIEMEVGDALWLMAAPDSTQKETVNWWYKSGSGAYFAAAGAPLYIPMPGISAVYRLIYCE